MIDWEDFYGYIGEPLFGTPKSVTFVEDRLLGTRVVFGYGDGSGSARNFDIDLFMEWATK